VLSPCSISLLLCTGFSKYSFQLLDLLAVTLATNDTQVLCAVRCQVTTGRALSHVFNVCSFLNSSVLVSEVKLNARLQCLVALCFYTLQINNNTLDGNNRLGPITASISHISRFYVCKITGTMETFKQPEIYCVYYRP
jgi:hypothetical protein